MLETKKNMANILSPAIFRMRTASPSLDNRSSLLTNALGFICFNTPTSYPVLEVTAAKYKLS